MGCSVIVKVVDLCWEFCNGDFNFFCDVFRVIVNIDVGNVCVEYIL